MKKITFIIYASVIALTGLCALAFSKYLSVNIYSLLPVGIIVYMIYMGFEAFTSRMYYKNGRWRTRSVGFDFKYSKSANGEGNFEVYNPIKSAGLSNKLMAYSLFLGASLNIPLIFFFDYKIKLFSIGILIVSGLVGGLLALPHDLKAQREIEEAEKAKHEQWERELEEQKKREELGKWK